MTVFQAILLGVLQGVAEFLPISSSGHLAVAQKLFGLEDIPLLFDVMLHLATLAAVVLYFRKKILELLCIFIRWITLFKKYEPENLQAEILGRKTILALIFATIVTGIIGVFTSKFIPDMSIKVTCAGFIITALLLVSSSIMTKRQASTSDELSENKGISILQGLFIGFMQGLGTLPGISRSGSTIAGAQFVGVNRAFAGEFSFIVSIPAILGAFILEVKDLGDVSSQIGFLPVLCGCFAAFAWGYLSLSVLMKLIKKGKLEWFAVYLIPLGIAGLLYF